MYIFHTHDIYIIDTIQAEKAKAPVKIEDVWVVVGE